MSTYEVDTDLSETQLTHYLSRQRIAVDTELHGLNLQRDQICLVQMCDEQGNVCLIKPEPGKAPRNMKALLENSAVLKVFHFALTDVAFFQSSLGIRVTPFNCTKVMSKLIRTYSQSHGLKDLHLELLGIEMKKEQQQTNWASNELSQEQLQYAATDVLRLLQVYHNLQQMIDARERLSSGSTIKELNETAQAMLPGLVELLLNGYGDLDSGWQTSLFSH